VKEGSDNKSNNSLTDIIHDMYRFAELSNSGVRERLHFWLTGRELALALAVRATPGLKLAVWVPPWADLTSVVRKLSLFSDILLIAHDRSLPVDGFMVMPAPPDFWSPRIGVRRVYRSHEEAEEAARSNDDTTNLPPYPILQEPGPLATRGTPGGLMALARFTDCPYPELTYRWIFEEARPLIEAGRVLYAPFLTPPTGKRGPDLQNPATVAAYQALGAAPSATPDHCSFNASTLRVLFHLDLPYVENIPIDILTKLLGDEAEELGRFRQAVLAACAEAAKFTNTSELESATSEIQRDIIDGGIAELSKAARKMEKRRWFRAAGCTIASVALEVVTLLTGIILPGVSLAPSFVEWAWHAIEQGAFEKHSMHFLWRLRNHPWSAVPANALRYWEVPWQFDALAATGYFGHPLPHGLVCVPEKGKRYHLPTCRHVARSAIVMRVDLALENGFQACSECLPTPIEGPNAGNT